MQAEWPKRSIGPNRSKKQQEDFKQLIVEYSERRRKGERVIIVNDRIVVNKRNLPSASTLNSIPTDSVSGTVSSLSNQCGIQSSLSAMASSFLPTNTTSVPQEGN
jgi:hypothetical protein